MPKEELQLRRASVLIAAFHAGLIELDKDDLQVIGAALKHPMKEIIHGN